MLKAESGRHLHNLALAAALLFYLFLAISVSRTKLPICDEGWYADPAENLVKNGSMGSPVIESAGGYLKGIERYTYWEMPLHIVTQAGWYELFGAGLFSVRALSVTAGLLALVCWYIVVLRMSDNRTLAILTVFFAEIDTTFIALSATGRTDMLSVAFGAAAQASYLILRTKNLRVALLLGHGFVVASGLTHPIGGLVSLATILILQAYLDKGRFEFSDFLPIAVPYLIGGCGWAVYIMKSPDLFWAQFGGNSAQRLWPWKSPLLALRSEIMERFIGSYRTGSSSWTPLANLRLLILLTYVAGLMSMVFRRELRSSRIAPFVFAQTGLTFFILLFFEGAKQQWYLIHLVWPLAIALAASLDRHWQQRVSWRPILGLVVVGFICIELGYPALLIAQNRYRNSYCPLVGILADRAKDRRFVMGSAELGFGLGFDKVLDDHHLGYFSQKELEFIVLDPVYRGWIERCRTERPEEYRYIHSLLARRYRQVYSNAHYSVWEHIDNAVASKATAGMMR